MVVVVVGVVMILQWHSKITTHATTHKQNAHVLHPYNILTLNPYFVINLHVNKMLGKSAHLLQNS
jgi:hypothetical protein